jgi:hypothetical protein
MSVLLTGGTVVAVLAFIATVAIDYMSNRQKRDEVAPRIVRLEVRADAYLAHMPEAAASKLPKNRI